jgi:four helix bundle protein
MDFRNAKFIASPIRFVVPPFLFRVNIAEEQAHFNKGEFVHFLRHANGSLAELETQLLISERLEYTEHDQIQPLIQQVIEVGKLLNGLINSLRR